MSWMIAGFTLVGAFAGAMVPVIGAVMPTADIEAQAARNTGPRPKSMLIGACTGAAIFGGLGWIDEGGLTRYMEKAGERAAAAHCLKYAPHTSITCQTPQPR